MVAAQPAPEVLNRHLLVTISNEPSCFYGVRFVVSFFSVKKNINVTLFYVGSSSKEPNDVNRREATEAQKMALDLLTMSGFPEKNITMKIAEKRFGIVQDIVREGHEGLYDAVVLGRRGYLAFEGLLGTSTSREILEARIDFPVWVCKSITLPHRHIIVATDGSEASLRIADHVGFMIKDEDHTVTVCHVGSPSEQSERIIEEAVEAILANGVEKERITTEIIQGKKPAEALLQKMKESNAIAMAIGRSKAKEGTLRGWLMGSCSSKILSDFEAGALWISK
ncbi:MAG: universal stress protein [Thermodesulforhabdaceae bacterium]|jgi:nucleotide-binding universal stress UspA family protein